MDYFLDNFTGQIAMSAVLVALTAVAAIVSAARTRPRDRVRVAARAGAVGLALAGVAATSWDGLDDVGGGQWSWGIEGWGVWRAEIAAFPNDIASVLTVGNLLVFAPVGFCVAVGWWRRRRFLAFVVALTVPLAVELAQGLSVAPVVGGVGSPDDALLNVIGLVLGWLIGASVMAITTAAKDRAA